MALDYIPPELDPSSREMIDALQKRALSESDEDIARKTMENVGSERGLIDNPAGQMKAQGLKAEGGNDDLLRAINQRASQKYESSVKNLGIQAKHDAMNSSMARKAKAVDLLAKEQAYNEQVKQAKAKAEADRRAARAATIGAVMGIAGAAAGAYAGGPAGAMAGYGVGSGVGTMAGNQM